IPSSRSTITASVMLLANARASRRTSRRASPFTAIVPLLVVFGRRHAAGSACAARRVTRACLAIATLRAVCLRHVLRGGVAAVAAPSHRDDHAVPAAATADVAPFEPMAKRRERGEQQSREHDQHEDLRHRRGSIVGAPPRVVKPALSEVARSRVAGPLLMASAAARTLARWTVGRAAPASLRDLAAPAAGFRAASASRVHYRAIADRARDRGRRAPRSGGCRAVVGSGRDRGGSPGAGSVPRLASRRGPGRYPARTGVGGARDPVAVPAAPVLR